MEFISILGDTGLVACRECRFSVLPSSFDTHFRAKPHSLSKETREKILSEATKYPSLIWDLENLKNLEIPTSFSYFFPELSLFQDGVQCPEYLYTTRNRISIREHYSTIHG